MLDASSGHSARARTCTGSDVTMTSFDVRLGRFCQVSFRKWRGTFRFSSRLRWKTQAQRLKRYDVIRKFKKRNYEEMTSVDHGGNVGIASAQRGVCVGANTLVIRQ